MNLVALNRYSALISEIRVSATDDRAHDRFDCTNLVPRAHFRRRTDSPQTQHFQTPLRRAANSAIFSGGVSM